jgi:hypothetical protein
MHASSWTTFGDHACLGKAQTFLSHNTIYYRATYFIFLIILRHALSERPVDTCVVWVN